MSIELFHQATDYARGVMSDLTHEDLRLPTPCVDWDAGRVVLHLADVADALLGLLETGDLALPEPQRVDAPDPVAVVHERLAKLDEALSVETDTARVESAVRAGAIELTTHGWDIGFARDPAHRIPEPLAGDVLALVSPVLDDDARGENFAAPIDVPPNASMSDRLTAFLGRTSHRPTAGR